MPQPVLPSVRLALGKAWYTCRRHALWRFSGVIPNTRTASSLPVPVFQHRSPIMRPLRDVDMYLQENKKTNLALALQRLDGVILRPGESFSFWRNVGRPTRAKGYLEGLELFRGSLRKGTGGGLCQLSNLIYWMTLHTPLAVTERHRHSFDVFPDAERTQPFGSGATVAYNYIDLCLTNPTVQEFQLRLWLDEEFLNGEWRSAEEVPREYSVFEKNHRIEGCACGHLRKNELYRTVADKETGERFEEFIADNQAFMMYNPLLEA